MKRGVAIAAAVIALASAAYLVLQPPAPPAAMLEANPPLDAATVARGAYLAKLGDCGACHTSEGGEPMAGGLPFVTPMGVLYSTNITPDRQTGIGGYTLAQFEGALRRGVAADGRRLYPAMPFPSFAKVDDDDVKALYAYFMKGVAPVAEAARPNAMRFPFNLRLGLALWDLAFLDGARFAPEADKDAQWNRGAYLVEGLGHCGTCHTPRGWGMQELATREDGRAFLSGSTVPPWRAVDLRRQGPETEIVKFLQTGSNDRAAAFGVMTEVVANSTQYFSNEDLAAVARFLASLSPPPPPAAAPVVPPELYATRGGLGYDQFCASCHGRDGRGAPGVFPPLAGNSSATSDDPTSVIHLALTGWTTAKTRFSEHVFSMPRFATLRDDEIAEILTFARAAWGNAGSPVRADQVRAMREATAAAPPASDRFVVPRFADLLGDSDAPRLILGMRLMTETQQLLPRNVGDAMTCASCHLEGGTVARASPFVGLTRLFPMYNARAGRTITMADRINGCFQRSMAGAPLPDDSPQMQAMIAFMDWMKGQAAPGGKIEGRGTAEVGQNLAPDAVRGRTLFEADCAACHGQDGQGRQSATGDWLFPPLWGDHAFNIGAGIARTHTAAGFVKANMPIARGVNFPQGEGGLSDQDALDIAEYFTHQPHADFPGKAADWPKGGRPKDSRY